MVSPMAHTKWVEVADKWVIVVGRRQGGNRVGMGQGARGAGHKDKGKAGNSKNAEVACCMTGV